MSEARIHAVTVPKWGMAMDEGTVTVWHVAEGAAVDAGQELLDLESTKIANAIEAKRAGILRRAVAGVGTALPVGGLLGVIADANVPEAEIDSFVADFVVAAPDAEGEGAPRTATVEVGGRAIHYLDLGVGEAPIVLVHGFGGDLNAWLFNQPALAERGRTIALDLPGHGQSSGDVGEGTVAALSGTLLGFMDSLGLGAAHLVGHSLGGAIALAVAVAQPGRVRSLTLIASAGLGPEINASFIDGFLAAERRKDMTVVLGTLFADPALVTRQMVDDVLKAKRIDGAQAALARIAGACFPAGRQALDLRPSLADLAVPVQVIWGSSDAVIPAAHADGLPASVTVLRLQAGHMPHMEKAAEVTRAILAISG
ncbi:MAG: acetoin dehydrogenase dihydrolipoyllysine-residue acetyltransferase subunit [Alphaproteobacteria bacterium]